MDTRLDILQWWQRYYPLSKLALYVQVIPILKIEVLPVEGISSSFGDLACFGALLHSTACGSCLWVGFFDGKKIIRTLIFLLLQ